MGDVFSITLIFQAISSVLIGWLLLHFAKLYQRNYLFYWSISFFCLNLYLIAVYISSQLSSLHLDPSSWLRLGILFLVSFAGYLQIAFLMTGTITLVRGATISNKVLLRVVVICILIALSIFFQP